MIYDTFLFFNELELLEIRLNILNEIVDKFVIVECPITFTGKNKELFFLNNKERFKKFEDKIVHVIIGDYKPFDVTWDNEKYQRNNISKGLIKCKDDDIIMISDADEIPKFKSKQQIYDIILKNNPCTLKQHMAYYYVNTIENNLWSGTVITTFDKLKNRTPEYFRHNKDSFIHINDGGWHFSYLGGIERIRNKLVSFSHTEFSGDFYTNQERIKYCMNNHLDLFGRGQKYLVQSDEILPKYIIDNKERYEKLFYNII